ncbi:recombinase family protein [Sulfitobacter sp. D7]|jgi:DNA invertase Pin-like site-specific DNA recombinase|uniref:recombinase family protein n=1 Tax=Sulfitobacter sp. D7 TaxID=1968541 RepID=UPI0013C474A0|nr:recombinase family protein [Sulfitobacter sp. D7]
MMKKRRVIGYVRVSTREQEQKGISLDAQSALLRDYAHEKSMDLLGICEDAQSAYDQHSSKRPGLREVLSRAASEGLPILVVSVDRLSRSLKDLSLPEFSDVEIISVKEGKVGPRKLRKLVKAAEAASANAAKLSKEMVRSSIKKGRKPGNKTNLKEAQRSGAINNMLRSQRKVQELADFIGKNPSMTALSWSGRVEALNSSGNFNLVSEVHGEKQPWTIQSLRKPFKAALAEIQMHEDMDREDAAAAVTGSDDEMNASLPDHAADRGAEASKGVSDARVAAPVGGASQAHACPSGIPEGFTPSEAEGAAKSIPSPPALPQYSGNSRLNPDDYPLPLRRRPLNATEIALLRKIMSSRDLSESNVMDELGKPRLDPSLWQSRRNGTTVSPDMLGRLLKWFGENRKVWRS